VYAYERTRCHIHGVRGVIKRQQQPIGSLPPFAVAVSKPCHARGSCLGYRTCCCLTALSGGLLQALA